MSAGLQGARAGLDDIDPGYRVISISIDPEHDRPDVLRAYAERYGGDERWLLLTGTTGDVLSVVKAFDAYYGGNNKMYHRPYTLPQSRADQPLGALRRCDGGRGTHAALSRAPPRGGLTCRCPCSRGSS